MAAASVSQSTWATLRHHLHTSLRFLGTARSPAVSLTQRQLRVEPKKAFHSQQLRSLSVATSSRPGMARLCSVSVLRGAALTRPCHRLFLRVSNTRPTARTLCGLSAGSRWCNAGLIQPRLSLLTGRRHLSQQSFKEAQAARNKTFMMYMLATGILVVGFSYAAVPLYRLFCQNTGFGGATKRDDDKEKIAAMKPVEERMLRIKFNADTAATMRWNFRPVQTEAYIVPGETALAFYTATNPTDDAVIGISTYNVIPLDAGQYFNKIQCFCFEEQRLNPHEQVDLPVFFYIDPEFADDPAMYKVDEITLSYTFFESKDAEGLMPGQMTPTLPAQRLQKHVPEASTA